MRLDENCRGVLVTLAPCNGAGGAVVFLGRPGWPWDGTKRLTMHQRSKSDGKTIRWETFFGCASVLSLSRIRGRAWLGERLIPVRTLDARFAQYVLQGIASRSRSCALRWLSGALCFVAVVIGGLCFQPAARFPVRASMFLRLLYCRFRTHSKWMCG